MALQTANPIFCNNIGNATSFDCCDAAKQDSPACRYFLSHEIQELRSVCSNADCLESCSDPRFIFDSKVQDIGAGTGVVPIHHFRICSNFPYLAASLNQSILEPAMSSQVQDYVPRDASSEEFKSITYAVTDCLTATCRNAREPGRCRRSCSGVNLVVNSTTPSLSGLNECMNTLCSGNERSLPFADADVVGIGVFSAYLMQCGFVIILWFIFSGFKIGETWKRSPGAEETTVRTEEPPHDAKDLTPEAREQNTNVKSNHDTPRTRQSNFERFLEEFHVTQCYFSSTIQIAALTYGISSTNMLVTFMLIPLATNGVLPVVFTLVLLYVRNEKLDPGVVVLTVVCWILSSVVYWILYAHVVPINSDIDTDADYAIYRQFYYKLSATDACGGYSALAACPNKLGRLGRGKILDSSFRIRALTPIIWTFSTACLLAILVATLSRKSLSEHFVGMIGRMTPRKGPSQRSSSDMEMQDRPGNDAVSDATNGSNATNASSATKIPNEPNGSHPENTSQPSSPNKSKWAQLAYVLVTLCFLAGAGMQMALLTIAMSLKMMDRKDWGFGQVIAITVWVPPLVAYAYREVEIIVKKRKQDKEAKQNGSSGS